MKRKLLLLLALALLPLLGGCARRGGAGEPAATDPAAEWHYAVTTETETEEYRASDGTLIAESSYELPRLLLVNGVGGAYPDVASAAGVTEEMLAVCDAFNASMRLRVNAQSGDWDLGSIARAAYSEARADGREFTPLSDELRVSGAYQNGDLLSVSAEAYTYLGGVHPNGGIATWNFDLRTGEFFSWSDLGTDVDELRGALAENILAQIDAAGLADAYFDDYAETVAVMEDATVGFDDAGMTVTFNEYLLGPYAAGIQRFTVPYEAFEGQLNERGGRLLAR